MSLWKGFMCKLLFILKEIYVGFKTKEEVCVFFTNLRGRQGNLLKNALNNNKKIKHTYMIGGQISNL